MGTVLSVSPLSGREDRGEQVHENSRKSLKKPSVIVSTLTFKRLVSAKKKSSKKVAPNPVPDKPNCENARRSVQQSNTERKSKQGFVSVPIPRVPSQQLDETRLPPSSKLSKSAQKQRCRESFGSPEHVVVQASTGELLRCLGEFMCRRCFRLKGLSPSEIILWFRNVDRTLLMQGWQEQGFITPSTLVFVYLLCRETVHDDIGSPRELQGLFLTCLYLAYSYLGSEISYPLKPFISDGNKDVFWKQSLEIINKLSSQMLQIHTDARFFTEVFHDLKNEVGTKVGGPDR
ncbi:cyclin-dependent kinase 5 activator 2b [Brachyhypopomus gauderio]|uniref:cyclin-dependent kinase 5 activator 2b n=1 Tax=Brachyhypopomus gauderio TaxID=698409 RepID=UPI00404141A7